MGLLSNRYKGYASPAAISTIYYVLGDKDLGYEWMSKAFEVRSATIPMTNNCPSLRGRRRTPGTSSYFER
ncbi:MAG: hypothetical protein OK422_05735 [Thaumarchaeota archaeon]|nr:hypothetical protein [Nitrososphaerota archaeon]